VPDVYLETSFFSQCVTIRTDAVDIARRQTTLEWWEGPAKAFDLCISPEVVRELSSPHFPSQVRDAALEMLRGLDTLTFTEEVAGMAELLVRERVMPGPAVAGDALHLAFCIVHRVEYLLTWNQKHLANPKKRTHLAIICARLNLPAPQIVTPDLMSVEDEDD
jgi:hypothetical protein